MTSLWLFLAFWAGGCLGFLLFAGLQVSREFTRERIFREAVGRNSLLPMDVTTEVNFASPTRKFV